MIVVDASSILDVLLQKPGSDDVEDILFETGQILHTPHLLDLEVAQVIRRYVANGQFDEMRGERMLKEMVAFPLRRHSHDTLLPRIWGLRANMTAYDAAYVALAEALKAPLLTRDQRLAETAMRFARIEVV